MRNNLHKNIREYLQQNKARKRNMLVIIVLALCTMIAVYSFMLVPAISMVGAEFNVEAKNSRAAFGSQMLLRVEASVDANSKEDEIVFLLAAKSTGGGLSQGYIFNEDNICTIQTQGGGSIELHREWTREGSSNARDYWFTLKPGESASFYLNFTSDTALYDKDEWAKQNIESVNKTEVQSEDEAEESDESSEQKNDSLNPLYMNGLSVNGSPNANSEVQPVILQPLKLVDEGEPQAIEFEYLYAENLEKAFKVLDSNKRDEGQLKSFKLIWMNEKDLPINEPRFSAQTEDGLHIIMTGSADSFPADIHKLSLEVKEKPADENDKKAIVDNLAGMGIEVRSQQVLELNLLQDGEPAQLEGPVNIKIEGIYNQDDSLSPYIYEFGENSENFEELQVQHLNDGSVLLETDNLSTYAVILSSSPFGSIPSGSYAWDLCSSNNPLGDAAKFNLFSLGDVGIFSTIYGNAAIGGNLKGSSTFSIAQSQKEPTALIFNGTSTQGRTQIGVKPKVSNNIWINKNLELQYRKNLGMYIWNVTDSDEIAEFADIDTYFSQMGDSLKKQNAKMSTMKANGTHSAVWGSLTFEGTDPELNIFTISATELLENPHGWKFTVPESSSILVNITGGKSIDFKPAGIEDKNNIASRILWNFAPSIEKVNVISHSNLLGSVMAPSADFDISNVSSAFVGTVVVGSLTSTNSVSFSLQHATSTFKLPAGMGDDDDGSTKSVSVNVVWKSGEAPLRGNVVLELRKGNDIVDTVTISADSGWSHVWSDLPEGKYTVAEVGLPEGYFSRINEETEDDTVQNFTLIGLQALTGDLTVNVSKTWDGGVSGASTVRIHLLANGTYMEPERYIDLVATNGWSGSFQNLPERDENGDPISYSIWEEPIVGWTPSVEVTRVARQEGQVGQDGGWFNVPTNTNSLQVGQIYRFVSGTRALANTSSSSVTGANLSDTSTSQQWRVVSSDGNIRLQNVSTNRYLRIRSNGISTTSNSSDATNIQQNWSSDSVRLGDGTSLNSNYIAMSGSTVSRTNQSGGTYLTAQTYTEPIPPIAPIAPSISFAVTNYKVGNPEENLSFPHYKQIDFLDDGIVNPDTALMGQDLYRLYLDARTKGHPMDLVLVVDRSGSMQYSTVSGEAPTGSQIRRDQAVRNMLNGTGGEDGFINRFLSLNEQNNISIVWFGGDYYGNGAYTGSGSNNRNFNSVMDSGVVTPWTKNKDYEVVVYDTISADNQNNPNNISYRNATGTNYMAGMWAAADMLRSDSVVAANGHKKMVIFLTDGIPTYHVQNSSSNTGTPTYQQYQSWVNSGRPNTFYRTGDGSTTNTTTRNATNSTFSNFVQQNPGVIFSSIMFAPTNENTDILSGMTANGGSMRHTQGDDSLPEVFADMIAMLTFSKNFSITDNLSQYVEWYTPQPDLKLLRTNLLTGAQHVLWQSSGPAESGVIGSPTSHNNVVQNGVSMQVIDSITYVPNQMDNSTGTIQILFNQDYEVDISNKYTISFNVKTTEYAYTQYAQNWQNGDSTGYLNTVGDPGTDFQSNTTSSNQPGFNANHSAILKYRYDGEFYEEPYDHPVIQVSSLGVLIEKTDIGGNALLPGAKFDLYMAAAAGDSGAVLIPGLEPARYGIKINQEPIVTGEDGTVYVTSLSAGTYHLVETGAPTGYVLLSQPIGFELGGANPQILDPNGMAEFTGTAPDGNPILSVRNTNGYQIPATGGRGTAVLVGLASTLMILSGLLLILKKRRSK